MNLNSRIKLFEEIRDTPFILTGKKSMYCFKKCLILKDNLSKIEIKSKIMVGSFLWSQLSIPSKLKKDIKKDPENHVFLNVFIPETKKWVFIDPTWDKALNSIFPITNWDGLNETSLMTNLKNIKEYKFKKANPIRRLLSKIKRIFQDETNQVFYEKFDLWTNEIRINN